MSAAPNGTTLNTTGLFLRSSVPSPQPQYLLEFAKGEAAESVRTILRIRPDCTVEIVNGVMMDEASREFWRCVEIEGRTLIERAERAEMQMRDLDGEIARIEGVVAEEPEWNRAHWQAVLSGLKRARNILNGTAHPGTERNDGNRQR